MEAVAESRGGQAAEAYLPGSPRRRRGVSPERAHYLRGVPALWLRGGYEERRS